MYKYLIQYLFVTELLLLIAKLRKQVCIYIAEWEALKKKKPLPFLE